ncbi:hypothetical protein LEP1GSC016_3351 [Leptospira borgpetersenii serovar Hardjo-bovis str. Sponselee]|uniref:Uncharacterized protein n=1 Tax=Leptospira borgpetersenii serovar Hardjo-bovis str. Sponselee TaxID=1303729 RepID=M6BBE0_LEPBO|nr:hypothetical protein LEP1GSC016_3351 [Leptospira borgpetersenii serovar Hardjo-bovis str. Sponselee]
MICGNSHALLRAYEMIMLISFQVLGQVLNVNSIRNRLTTYTFRKF